MRSSLQNVFISASYLLRACVQRKVIVDFLALGYRTCPSVFLPVVHILVCNLDIHIVVAYNLNDFSLTQYISQQLFRQTFKTSIFFVIIIFHCVKISSGGLKMTEVMTSTQACWRRALEQNGYVELLCREMRFVRPSMQHRASQLVTMVTIYFCEDS